MKKVCLLLSLGFFSTGVSADKLDALDFLAGYCWSGALANGKVDTHCFNWVYGKQFLRDTHEVAGGRAYQGESVYRVDAEGVIQWVYFESDGGWSEGTAVPEGDKILFPEETWQGEDGKTRVFRTVWTDITSESYHSVTEERIDGVWQPSMDVKFSRQE